MQSKYRSHAYMYIDGLYAALGKEGFYCYSLYILIHCEIKLCRVD